MKEEAEVGRRPMSGRERQKHSGEASERVSSSAIRVLVPIICALALTSCGGSGPSTGPGRIDSVIAPKGHPRELLVGVETDGYCVGSQHIPTAEAAEVEELAHSRVVLKIPVHNYAQHGSGCAGVGIGLQVTVHTKSTTEGISVYDASESPPRPVYVHHWNMSKRSQRLREYRWAREAGERYRREMAHWRAVRRAREG